MEDESKGESGLLSEHLTCTPMWTDMPFPRTRAQHRGSAVGDPSGSPGEVGDKVRQ